MDLLIIQVSDIWESVKNYYLTLGEKYHVNPAIFFGIHVIATPPFIASGWWIVRNNKKKRSLLLPILSALFFFNVANIYLVAFGKNIPIAIYAIITGFSLFSGYVSYKKIRKRMQ